MPRCSACSMYSYSSSRRRYIPGRLKSYRGRPVRRYPQPSKSSNAAVAKRLTVAYQQPRSLSSSSTYDVRRMYVASNIISSSSFQDFIAPFQLAFLPGYTEFTALYDQYRVNKLVYHFIPLFNQNPISNTGTACTSLLLTAVDYDGGATGLSFNQFLEYETCVVTPCCSVHKVTIQPRAETAAIASSSTVSVAMASPSTWWDCSTTTVSFNSVRYALTAETGTSSAHIQYSIWIEAFLTFKTTR